MLPEAAKKLLRLEAKNLQELRKKLRMFMYGTFTGGALQIMRAKKELEDYLARELLLSKIFTRDSRAADLGVSVERVTEDDVLASNLAANSFATAWAQAHISEIPFNWIPRLNRIVATETSRSFSDVAEEVAKDYMLIREWVSVLDMKTCPRCRAMHGETTQPGETFHGGLEPGWVHPSCRCYAILVIK